jgi:uncharacterized membrane protein
MNDAQGFSRHVAIDLARVMAILFMIQGHALDVLLAPEFRHGFVFDKWLFLRGLTAPTFFMLAGASFTLASMKGWDSFLAPTQPFFRRLRRFSLFILLGYLMHFPVRSFSDIRWLDKAGWQSWFQVDVLQCIGFSLVALQVLLFVAKTPKRFATFALCCAALIALLTPLMWQLKLEAWVPRPLAAYLNGNSSSLFPLFPWSGYVLFGAAVGYLCAARKAVSGSLPARELACGGTLLFLAGIGLQRLPIRIYRDSDYWLTSPNLFLVRVGCVCVLIATLAFIAQRVWLPQGAIRSLAQESLTIYIIHVAILYGSLWNTGLRQSTGSTLSVWPTLAWIAAMLISMMMFAWIWNRAKYIDPRRIRFVRAALAVAFVYSLI